MWKPFKISLNSLCYGDMDKTIKVECYDYDNDGSHDLIGTFQTTMTKLKEASRSSPVSYIFAAIKYIQYDYLCLSLAKQLVYHVFIVYCFKSYKV